MLIKWSLNPKADYYILQTHSKSNAFNQLFHPTHQPFLNWQLFKNEIKYSQFPEYPQYP